MLTKRRALSHHPNPKALLRFAIPLIAMTMTSVATIMLMNAQLFRAANWFDTSGADAKILIAMTEVISKTTYIGLLGILIMGLFTFLFWVFFSKNIFGPIVPFRQHLDKLCKGDFASRVRLRKGDEFKDLAEDLNHLAELLEQGKLTKS